MNLANDKPLFDTLRRLFGPLSQEQVDQIKAALAEPSPKIMREPSAFFKGVRAITGPLDQVQVDVLNLLLLKAEYWPTSWLAYGLATAWHEGRLEPIEEWGKGKGHSYGVPGKHGGQIPYGRGLVQLTHDYNYEWADEALCLGGALLKDYRKALDPEIAVRIMVKGMEDGAFCPGQSLAKHLPDRLGTVQQFINSRPIINAHDKAELIARYAIGFQDAIEGGRWS